MYAKNIKDARKGVSHGVISAASWGINTVVIGIILEKTPYIDTKQAILLAPFVSSFMHDFFSSLWMILFMLVKGEFNQVVKYLKTRNGKVIALGAVIGGPVGMTCYFLSVKYIGPIYTASITSIFPGVGALLAFIFLKEKMNRRTWFGVLLSIIGVVVLGYMPSEASANHNFVLGILFALGGALAWGLEGVICAWGMKGEDADPFQAVTIRQTTSALCYAVIITPFIHGYSLTFEVLSSTVVWLTVISALLGTICYALYYKSIHLIGAARGTSLNITYAAFAIVIQVAFLGTPVSLQLIIGTLVVLYGSILVSGNLKELIHISDDFDNNEVEASEISG